MEKVTFDIESVVNYKLQPYQQALVAGFKSGEMMIMSSGRQSGKSMLNAMYGQLWNSIMDSPVSIRWRQLPGRKIQSYAEVGPQGFERGLRDSDMDEVQQWLWQNIPTAKRLSFDTWLFKEDKHVTMFLMKWSS